MKTEIKDALVKIQNICYSHCTKVDEGGRNRDESFVEYVRMVTCSAGISNWLCPCHGCPNILEMELLIDVIESDDTIDWDSMDEVNWKDV